MGQKSEESKTTTKTVAFIPVRGGSKSIPLKNIKEIAGKPLVYWTAAAACGCRYIDKVYIATDSEDIREVVEGFGLEKLTVIGRSPETASDQASTESALLEFAGQYDFEHVVLIQATSPLLTCKDLDGAFLLYFSEDTDSVLSVVRQKRFNWAPEADGTVRPSNYDVFHRPRRQEFDGYLVENGAFYITSREKLLTSENRLSGKIRAYEMPEETYFEIDEPSDWLITELLLKRRLAEEREFSGESELSKISDRSKLPAIPEIRMLLTDCDGCLTDGGMYYSENGDELKRFNTLDGRGIMLLRQAGILTGIITGETRELNRRRAQKLHIDILMEGIEDKLSAVKELSEKYGIPLENIAYIGDDIIDREAVAAVGLGCCVPNGISEVKEAAKYITKVPGGSGAIREVAELILNRAGSQVNK